MYRLLLLYLLSTMLCTCGSAPVAGLTKTALYDYDVEARLTELGIELETPGAPIANYVNGVRTGKLLFLAGKGPRTESGEVWTGKLGRDLSVEEGYAAARNVGITQLGVLRAELGDLNRVVRIVKVLGMVNATPEFTDHPKVVNGFSDLVVDVFGERGRHARAAVGVGSLPGGMACEIELVVEVE